MKRDDKIINLSNLTCNRKNCHKTKWTVVFWGKLGVERNYFIRSKCLFFGTGSKGQKLFREYKDIKNYEFNLKHDKKNWPTI